MDESEEREKPTQSTSLLDAALHELLRKYCEAPATDSRKADDAIKQAMELTRFINFRVAGKWNVLNAEDKEAVHIDGVMKVFNSARGGNPIRFPTQTLRRAFSNLYHDSLVKRGHKRYEVVETDLLSPDGEGSHLEALASGRSMDDTVIDEELKTILSTAIKHLPPYQRAIFLAYHRDSLSYEEIATTTELPIGTVKSRLARARLALRDHLEPYFSTVYPELLTDNGNEAGRENDRPYSIPNLREILSEHDVAPDTKEKIEAAFTTLSPNQRNALLIRVVYNASSVDIAEYLGLKSHSLNAYISRARWSLKAMLGDDYPTFLDNNGNEKVTNTPPVDPNKAVVRDVNNQPIGPMTALMVTRQKSENARE